MSELLTALIKKLKIWQRAKLYSDGGKLGQLIQLISGKPRVELDFQTLPSEDRVDHYRIQNKFISYFRDWHCIPKTLDPATDHLAIHPLFWQFLLKKREATTILNKRSCFPVDMQKGLQKL
jgi:hypothetical protein